MLKRPRPAQPKSQCTGLCTQDVMPFLSALMGQQGNLRMVLLQAKWLHPVRAETVCRNTCQSISGDSHGTEDIGASCCMQSGICIQFTES